MQTAIFCKLNQTKVSPIQTELSVVPTSVAQEWTQPQKIGNGDFSGKVEAVWQNTVRIHLCVPIRH